MLYIKVGDNDAVALSIYDLEGLFDTESSDLVMNSWVVAQVPYELIEMAAAAGARGETIRYRIDNPNDTSPSYDGGLSGELFKRLAGFDKRCGT